MKIAVSNIAWSPSERIQAYGLLNSKGVVGLEIAPSLLFHKSADPFLPTDQEMKDALGEIRHAGLELVSMQSLLFNVEGAAMFGDAAGRLAFLRGMKRAVQLAGRMEIPHLVFGSPRQRVIPEGMPMTEAREVAFESFRQLALEAENCGTVVGVEFNPPRYGTNFLTTAGEAAEFVRELGHASVKLVVDVGAVIIAGDFARIGALISDCGDQIAHVHISEPDLAPAPDSTGRALEVLKATRAIGYQGWHSIEMKAPPIVDQMAFLGASLEKVQLAGQRLVEAIGPE